MLLASILFMPAAAALLVLMLKSRRAATPRYPDVVLPRGTGIPYRIPVPATAASADPESIDGVGLEVLAVEGGDFRADVAEPHAAASVRP